MSAVRTGIITVSDSRSGGQREDTSGPAIAGILQHAGFEITERTIIPDEKEQIQDELVRMIHRLGVDLIITTGGTGLGPRDVTPEATLGIIDREVPGLAEAMRRESFRITPHALISRAVTGIRRQTLIINLPGSRKGAEECLKVILPAIPHAIEILRGQAVECGKKSDDSELAVGNWQ